MASKRLWPPSVMELRMSSARDKYSAQASDSVMDVEGFGPDITKVEAMVMHISAAVSGTPALS